MYYKGGSMLHTIRQLVNDDEKWRGILRGLQSTFWHQTVTAAQVENYIARRAGIDLSKVFQQYLTTTMVPSAGGFTGPRMASSISCSEYSVWNCANGLLTEWR